VKQYGLSLKQPWAALLANGHKTIEVRRWPTARRGRILIHAARVPDERPEAWALVPPHHLNDPAWFQPGLFGFTFTHLTVLPFRTYPGWMRFFPVDDEGPAQA